MIGRLRFWLCADRLGPEMLLTHWMLHWPSLMRRLCKKKLKAFGENSQIRPGAYLEACSKISIGDYVVIRPGTFLYADPTPKGGEIIIEDKVMLGPKVQIYTSNHAFKNSNIPIMDQGFRPETPENSVVCRKGSWIGAGAILLPGVQVGMSTVIGAGTVVTKSVPDGVVVVGCPGRIIKRIPRSP